MNQLGKLLLLFITIFAISSCTDISNDNEDSFSLKSTKPVKVLRPLPNSYIPLGQGLQFKFSKDDSTEIDSITIFYNHQRIQSSSYSTSFEVDGMTTKCGQNSLQIHFFRKGEVIQKSTFQYIVLASKEATILRPDYKRKIAHSRKSYTQGLEFVGNRLYESNGEYGRSKIHILENLGRNLGVSNSLDPQFFAEGLTVLNNTVYQLTWREHTLFKYDMALENKTSQPYPFETEGWGLSNDGKHLLMTADASNIVYRLNPESMEVISEIEVYHDRGPQERLNELELINGKLYANIYQSDKIAVIDTASGQIESYLDFSGLLPVSERQNDTDVLNGIAFHKETNEVYITGKKWPWIYIYDLSEFLNQ